MQFKYYVLNYDWSSKKVFNFNIFDNKDLQEYAEDEVRKYLRAPSQYKQPYSGSIYNKDHRGFEALCDEIEALIKWQECGRREYEISVGDAFETDCNMLEKWDCYDQCKQNIPIITREIIYQYKEQYKKKN